MDKQGFSKSFTLIALLAIVVVALSGCNLPGRQGSIPTPEIVPSPTPTPSDTQIVVETTQWYVETAGDDANDCLSPQTACLHLAAAIEKAGNGDTINIGTGTFFENVQVLKSLNFIGQGVDITIIDGHQTGLTRSIFYMEGSLTSAIAVSMSGITIQNGVSAHDENGKKGNGGAISAINVDLALEDMRIADNWANFSGGGIYCKSTFDPRQKVIIKNSVIEGNEAYFDGGGIWCNDDLELENVTMEANTAIANEYGGMGKGVAIYTEGNTALKNARLINNISNGSREALHFFAAGRKLTIEDSLIDSNQAGGVSIQLGSAEIRRSTISNNHLFGIDSRTELLIENSTVSGTQSGNLTGGISTLFNSNATIINVTLVGNDIGLAATSGGHAILYNTLFSGNQQTCFMQDGAGYQPSSITGENNLATNNNCGSAVAEISDALLGPYENYGGAVGTYPLLPGSPAIDAGKAIAGMTTDQRGSPRPLDGNGDGIANFDVGAYEIEAVLTTPTFTPTVTPTPTITPTFTPTSTATVSTAITFTSRVSTDAFQYKRDCVPDPSQVTISAILSNTIGVKSVLIFFRLESSDLGVTTSWNDGMTMSPVGSNEFKKTISWSDIPQLSEISGSSAIFAYQFVAVGQNDDSTRSVVYNDVMIGPCH